MPDALPQLPMPGNVHAMGLRVHEPLPISEWDDPRAEGRVTVIVPQPVTLRLSATLSLFLPVGTYPIPVRAVVEGVRVLQQDGNYKTSELITNIGGVDQKSMHWMLQTHGVKHSGVVEGLAPAPVIAPPGPAPDGRDAKIAQLEEQNIELRTQLARSNELMDRLAAKLDPPASPAAVPNALAESAPAAPPVDARPTEEPRAAAAGRRKKG